MTVVRRLSSDDLTPRELESLRALFDAAWPDAGDEFTQEDFDHALGGVHLLIEADGAIVSHASVVERELQTAGHRLATGYVEGVATLPEHRRRGYGSAIMAEVGAHTSVRTDRGLVPTPEEDGYVLVRLTRTSPQLDLSAPISCDWRPGDVW